MTTNPKGYNLLHKWVNRYLPKPALCDICHVNPPYDLANISGQYKRTLTDWQYLCRSCHGLHDRGIPEDRKCSVCGSSQTYTKKYNGRPLWQYVNDGGSIVCHTCYCKAYYYTKRGAESATSL